MRLLDDLGRGFLCVRKGIVRFGDDAGRTADVLRNNDLQILQQVQQAGRPPQTVCSGRQISSAGFPQLLLDAINYAEDFMVCLLMIFLTFLQ
jgi:hypothetical protein